MEAVQIWKNRSVDAERSFERCKGTCQAPAQQCEGCANLVIGLAHALDQNSYSLPKMSLTTPSSSLTPTLEIRGKQFVSSEARSF